jgi:hypothetical protein
MSLHDVGDWLASRSNGDVRWGALLLSGLGVALVDTVGQWLIVTRVGLWIRPLGLFIIAATVVLGTAARWGGASALIALGVLQGDWTGGVVSAVAAFVAMTITARLWGPDRDVPETPVAWVLRYAVVAVVGASAFATMSAWLLDVLGRSAFSVTVVPALAAQVPLAVAGAPVVRPIFERTRRSDWKSSLPAATATDRRIVLGVVLCWVCAGYLGSFLFRTVARVPGAELGPRLSPAIESFVLLWGPQGTYAQLLLGLVSLATIAIALRRGEGSRGPERD